MPEITLFAFKAVSQYGRKKLKMIYLNYSLLVRFFCINQFHFVESEFLSARHFFHGDLL